MSEGPRNYDLNFPAANELEKQTTRIKGVLERIAAHFASTDPSNDAPFKEIVDAKHVQKAADLLLGSEVPSAISSIRSNHPVFISFSHEDNDFVSELVEKLADAGIKCFKSDRDIRLAAVP